eukprot:CAMPEP_0119111494 /NCGR_PEP_ID=MMETSP1180-20130426/35865_1 /TAXON_ID=3052 ORGANISM="Chlamydomonas cf sp, Strain CCMP681" /NCGR_SAMPLE_ID=MMETSP1180 /ASSEMBLY_ACC=CAM_ASM_000741 /LENGTH=65 /DNA_ID=CAMNT_0007098485 /DNA_START=102 /DNA_END=299 /DNA_ORIENTATION=+
MNTRASRKGPLARSGPERPAAALGSNTAKDSCSVAPCRPSMSASTATVRGAWRLPAKSVFTLFAT